MRAWADLNVWRGGRASCRSGGEGMQRAEAAHRVARWRGREAGPAGRDEIPPSGGPLCIPEWSYTPGRRRSESGDPGLLKDLGRRSPAFRSLRSSVLGLTSPRPTGHPSPWDRHIILRCQQNTSHFDTHLRQTCLKTNVVETNPRSKMRRGNQ